MSKHREDKTLMDRLKSYYQGAEREAAKTTPFYVTGDGVMFADPKEVIRSQAVQSQLSAFESLRTEIQGKKSVPKKSVAQGN
ncbi:hypothetical protein [Pseudomonas sp. Y24-6]|uniref:hypothetical protein n=1 Tax=Pseudomonas sp. Y24-6 TaxID=2750013 RepID=UPI001CE1561B|nr:hypothetical protein [Pseudomonas sp. Y24-6]MCA4964503.1 hypothetical protein [Pseudomonas sp. Y24-6]